MVSRQVNQQFVSKHSITLVRTQQFVFKHSIKLVRTQQFVSKHSKSLNQSTVHCNHRWSPIMTRTEGLRGLLLQVANVHHVYYII